MASIPIVATVALASLATVQELHGAVAQADAYLDVWASELVERGRERRTRVDQSIDRYTTRVEERISAGLRTLGRERLIYRRETVGDVDWRRDGTVRIEMLGAREVIPPVLSRAQIPEELDSFMPRLAFDPAESDVFIRFDTTFLRHPLAPGSEEHYRFRSGDTATIRLPDGRTVRLFELVVIPRHDDFHLLSGSFWLDADTYGVVRAVFRPARPWDFDRDSDDDDDDDVPGFIKPIRGEIRYVTVEYGLWELRWWLPRVIAAEGVLQVSFMSMPMRYERRYGNYTVEGDTTRPLLAADSVKPMRPCRATINVVITNSPSDSARARRRAERIRAREEARAAGERCRDRYQVIVPDDVQSLLTSELLPADVYASGVELLTETELAELKSQVDDLVEAPWQLRPPTFAWGMGAANLLRYNRIEALSIGARTEIDLGRMRVEANARIGVADLEPNVTLDMLRETAGSVLRLGGYRRLAAANPEARPLGFGNSVNALLFGRDDGEYFRAWGVELGVQPGRAESQRYDLRLYAERQSAASAETDFSVRHLLDGDHAFRPNIEAARADQAGAAIGLRTSHGLDPRGFRWGGEVRTTAETGTFDFVRPDLTLRTSIPLGPLALALEAGAGTSLGDPPIQSEWFLGGPARLRGYDGGIVHGPAYWRGRIELSGSRPGARLTLFSDAGWAGQRAAFGTRDALLSAGIGGSFLDGLIRFDLARGLRSPRNWRLDLYLSRGL